MKRDFDLIRTILLNVDQDAIVAPTNELEYHLRLMQEGGLITLTREGEEFVSLCRDECRWQEAKKKIEDAGLGMPYWLLKDILRHLLERERLFEQGAE
jgi:hypothetical protein